MTINWESLEEDPRSHVWESWPGAVLLDDEIQYYSTQASLPLIDPFNSQNLKPARYQLTLGSEAKVGGKIVKIDENNPLRIPPHQVAIVRTHETLNLPRFLIARWNLSVDMVYRGLLWVGALQVDPGWVGYLPCPLYNLSNDPVEIKAGERLFTIDFVRTTRFVKGVNRSYPDKLPLPPLNPRIQYYDVIHLHSGPYEALKDLNELTEFRGFALTLFAVMFTAIAAIVAALGVIVARPIAPSNGELLGFWPLTALVLSSVAFVLSLFCIVFQVSSSWSISRRHSRRR